MKRPSQATGIDEPVLSPSSLWGSDPSPVLQTLADWVCFAPASGRIWFDRQRTLLFHASTFGVMRREIILALGPEKGRAVIEQIGYAQGKRDAELVRERLPAQHQQPQWSAGPHLHGLEGFVKVTRLQDIPELTDGGYREHLWADSVEADEHVAAFGPSHEPVCWMLCGYAAGYGTTIHGRPTTIQEVECSAMGHAHCRIRIFSSVNAPANAAPAGVPVAGSSGSLTPGPRLSRRSVASTGAGLATGTGIIGTSAPMRAALRLLGDVADTRAAVLLRGESGVGKELFASALHKLSPRRDAPFVAVNCAAIPEALVEAELFGVERGAFTGAATSRPGRFERANGGTLFLDEVGLMSTTTQAKLLRAIQEQEIERVGATRATGVDVRLVAATNVDLWDAVRQHRFRDDLFFRLNVFPIDLPPLRARRGDIPLLIDNFMAHYMALHRRPGKQLTSAALEALLNYDYPGNVRELQNLIERGVIASGADALIDTGHLFRQGEMTRPAFILGDQGRLRLSVPTAADATDQAAAPDQSLEAVEQQLCRDALRASGGNVSLAARRLGLTRPTLDYRLRKWGIRV